MDFKLLPKIELHCHLDGSVRAKTIIDIARKESIEIPSYEISEVESMVIAPPECKSLDEYLARFQISIMVMQSKESLRRVAFELFEDAAIENLKEQNLKDIMLQVVATNERALNLYKSCGFQDTSTMNYYELKK